MPFADAIVNSAKRMRGYAEKAVVGITDEIAAHKPEWGRGNGRIDCNHAAFVFGHLALYPLRLMDVIGIKHTIKLPNAYEGLFKAGAPCHHDEHGTIYPRLSAIMPLFYAGHDALFAAAAKLSDADLAKPITDEKMKAHFPNVGEALTFMLCSHTAIHIGQVSTWRRAMGLPSAM